jgi:hypothetical protein
MTRAARGTSPPAAPTHHSARGSAERPLLPRRQRTNRDDPLWMPLCASTLPSHGVAVRLVCRLFWSAFSMPPYRLKGKASWRAKLAHCKWRAYELMCRRLRCWPMSQMGHSRPGRASSRSSHVRYASKGFKRGERLHRRRHCAEATSGTARRAIRAASRPTGRSPN